MLVGRFDFFTRSTAGGAALVAGNSRDFTESRYGPVEVYSPRRFPERQTRGETFRCGAPVATPPVKEAQVVAEAEEEAQFLEPRIGEGETTAQPHGFAGLSLAKRTAELPHQWNPEKTPCEANSSASDGTTTSFST